jgi:regulator of protease activity HflC (stomatin/prohibitin superfamily)
MALGFITGIIIAIFAIAAFIGLGVCVENDSPVGTTLLAIVGAILVVAFIIVPFSFHTVNTGEVAVVKHMGEIREVKTAGTSYAFWGTNKYMIYDAKVQNVESVAAAYSADAQTMNVSMTIQYQILSDEVINIATQYGSLDVLQSRITSIAIEKTKSVLSAHKAMDIIANRASISPAVETAIKEAVGAEYYVNIVAVVLTDIEFSEAFEAAVEAKMIAEQAKLQAEYENEKKVAQAEAEAEAKLKAAQAEIEIAKAKAEALKIAADAEAEANKTIAESLTEEILNKLFVDNWDGKLPAVIGGDGKYILPSEILG